MERFALIVNESKDTGARASRHIDEYLRTKGATCLRCVQHREEKDGYVQYRYEVPDGTECCIVLGGDGTMLQAAGSTFGRDIPLLGVNLGTLGYLTEVEADSIDQALDRLLGGEYGIEERMMIRGALSGAPGEVYHALNDIVIARCSSLRVIPFNVYVNGLCLTSYEGDGMIISTPTGSTGYNMSAGGPIVEPDARILLLTPICPHTIGSRTIVLSDRDEVRVELAANSGRDTSMVEVTFDGMERKRLTPGESILITASSHTTGIVRLCRESFLETLHRKLA